MASEGEATAESTRRSNQRLPAPALFVGPATQKQSNAELHSADQTTISSTAEQAQAQQRQTQTLLPSFTSTLTRQRSQQSGTSASSTASSSPAASSQHLQIPGSSAGRSSAPQQPTAPPQKPRATPWRPPPPDEAADAQWKAMQSTLEEVELSAAAGGASAFGAGHARALEELRRAQVALAQAWARGEGEDDGAEGGDQVGASGGGGVAHAARMRMGSGGERGAMDDETEKDILLAKRRRAANDRYFEKVNAGVVDVVQKLGVVAAKMGDVETESQEIWGDDDDDDDGDAGSLGAAVAAAAAANG